MRHLKLGVSMATTFWQVWMFIRFILHFYFIFLAVDQSALLVQLGIFINFNWLRVTKAISDITDIQWHSRWTVPTWWIFSNYGCHGKISPKQPGKYFIPWLILANLKITYPKKIYPILAVLFLYHHYIVFISSRTGNFLGKCIHIVFISLQENTKHRMRNAGNQQTT